ncbi:MAG: hypothetical protein V4594_01620 [Bacteroidota bacterium]
MQLISKVQYKRSEKGEFHEIASRNLEETVALIKNYPWNTERSLASIELTCPSVTIEYPNGTYLKAGPYFSGKFSLYYLAYNKKVYLKTVETIEEVCQWVSRYFEQKGQLDFSEKYGFTFSPEIHFRTNPFEYTVNVNNIAKYYRFLFFMMCVIPVMCLLKFADHPEGFSFQTPVILMGFFLFLFSPLIYLYFNYLSADKDKYLQLSRGHDDFTFGTYEEKIKYSKQDIIRIEAYGMHNSRSLWRESEVFVITLHNGEQLKFSSLLIPGYTFRSKFPDHRVTEHRAYFPTL